MKHEPTESPDRPATGLRALRQQRQLSQTRLGKLAGVSQARISHLEADPAALAAAQPGAVARLAAALGVDAVTLRAVTGLPSLVGVSDTARRFALAADRLPEEHRLLYLALIEHEAGKDRS